MRVADRVRRYAAREAMWTAGTPVVVALSGGSDSVALLFVLHELQQSGDVRIACVAHLNHRIRPEADADEAFCRALAERLALPFASRATDVPRLATERRLSSAVAARLARREFLEAVCADAGAARIATGHTEDDQAETVLLRLIRGAGARGLSGIAPRRGRWIRPLLCATRGELRAMLQAGGETWRDDASNADVSVPRNRVRHEVLPYLQRHFNPSIRQALARVAATVRPDEQALDRDAVAAAASLLERHPEGRVQIDAGRLLALPRPLATRVVVHALTAVAPAMPSRDAVTAVMAVASGHPAAADLSAVRVEHFSGNVVLVRRRSLREPSPFRFELPVPGRVVGPGWTIEAALAGGPQGPPLSDVEGAHIDAATLALPLVVRSRRPGDRLRPLGLGGRKKLQDVLVDRKVNRRERDGVAVVTDAAERIVWVAGHVLSEEFRVTARTTSVIILKFRRV